MFFVIGPLWLILILFLLSTRIGFRIFVVMVWALIGLFVWAVIAKNADDANRTAAMKTGVFDCRVAVAANDYETYTRHDVWNYCAGAFGGEEQWQAFLKADEDRRDAEDAQRSADDQAVSDAKDRDMAELGKRSLKP